MFIVSALNVIVVGHFSRFPYSFTLGGGFFITHVKEAPEFLYHVQQQLHEGTPGVGIVQSSVILIAVMY